MLLLLAPVLAAAQTPDFGREVRPILSRACFACHGPDGEHREAGLRLDRAREALAERDGGPAIVPGSAARSALVRRIRAADPGTRMPPPDSGKRLEPEEIETLARWIEGGAEYAEHWAFVAPRRVAPPAVSDPGWPRSELDAFVLARLDAAGQAPAPEADRHILARRLALDLTGLPPTPEEARALAGDPRPDAYERYVEELLADPAYGERWASVWLDLARYADSAGYGSDPLRDIWRWRDWVIDALNANQPYDEFTRDQLAGDLLPGATVEQRLATAFHRNTMTNTEGGTDDEEFRVEAVKDRASTTMAVWMGLTARCAQCHNHKFDPLSQEEYYRLFAFFDQTADADRPDEAPRLRTPTRAQESALAALERELEAARGRLAEPPHYVDAALAAWMGEARERERSWRSLAPLDVTSAAGADIAVTPDGDLLVAGGDDAPERDTYRIELELPPGRWTGLALDATAAGELPGGGPGLSPGNGNFVLTELALERPPSGPAAGRYVRFDLPGPGRILSLAEVQVLAGGENLAPAGRATQSSTAYDGPAALAIDGRTDGRHAAGSVTHTATEADPWWELDLGAERSVERPIERLVVWNRTDGDLAARLDGVRIAILDAERRALWSTRLARAPAERGELALAEVPREVPLAGASASFEQQGFPAAAAIDGQVAGAGGWAIAPRQGSSQRLVVAFAAPLELARPERATLRLAQDFGTRHVLGRLAVAVTEHAGAPRALPADVAAALAAAPECSDEERALLVEHFARVDPARAALRAEVERLEGELAALDVATTPVLEELPADRRRTTHVLVKGNFLDPAQAVTPGVPEALHPWPAGAPLDRRGLAAWLTSPENPLTARVAANRLWARLFGVGLVATEEDFGSQGAPPSHPGLLDWLALELVESGWDQKRLLRTIVTSATYRQSARVTAEKLARDPTGELLSRAPRLRLPAEMVRDQALAVSGLLSREMHGPSVFPPQPEGLWRAAFNGQRSWATSAGADRHRRALYTFWRRTIPYPAMEVFDAPSRETCTLRRLPTNTPLQAFVTLNDPAFVEAAQALARRMLAEVEPGAADADRARRGLWLALARPPAEEAVAELVALVRDARANLAARPEADVLALATDPLGPLPAGLDAREAAAWTAAANVLLNLDAVLTRD